MNSITGILLALHGSQQSIGGQQLAISWARRGGAEVTGLAVIDETVAGPTPVPIGGGAFKQQEQTELLSEQQQIAEAACQQFADRCRNAGIKFGTEQRAGVPHHLVADAVQGHDVAIVSTESAVEYGVGESPAEALESLIAIAPRPVISSPRNYRPGHGVLVAVDGSAAAARAAFALVGSGVASLDAVRILTVDPESEQSAHERARYAIDYFQRRRIPTTFQPIISECHAWEVICEQAEQQRSEVIVLGPHARTAIAEFFFGSVTKKTIEHSVAPVFLYH
jgi:nucleotide-binding universal stress UspA family protein